MVLIEVNMKGYLIGQLEVKNHDRYKEYVEKVTPVVQKYGGVFLIRGGKHEVVEGEWKFSRNILIEFPSYKKAKEWYFSAEAQPIKKIRLENSIGNQILIQGS